MAKIYRNRILAGTVLFEDVPLNWKNQTKLLLRKDVVDGVITAEQYKVLVGEDYPAEPVK